MYPSSGKADEDNCSSKDCSIGDRYGSLGSNNSIANSSEDNAVGYSEEKGSKCALSVKATGRVAGYERKGHYGTIQTPNPESRNMDEDEISTQLLLQDINLQDSLSEAQKAKLLNLVHKYKPHFTKKTGKCNCFKYRFELQGGLPKSRNSRPIPFALRKEVQEQIQEMLANNIIEESYSSYVNPPHLSRAGWQTSQDMSGC